MKAQISTSLSVDLPYMSVRPYVLNDENLDKFSAAILKIAGGDHGTASDNNSDRLFYIVSGKGKVMIDNETYFAKKGDVFVIPKSKTYNIMANSADEIRVLLVNTPAYRG